MPQETATDQTENCRKTQPTPRNLCMNFPDACSYLLCFETEGWRHKMQGVS